ncbi:MULTISPECIES: DUF1482 family protein [Brenneria]|uniref:DUF1482 domain-containing protein n=1 Tax=Brenneria nigrifluens DSM 30175 = ATCC 13028 TaxID=1121120 RepID=A0A2U1UU18_9GAMM|nr:MULTISPECIES: DUF1482 family protein [Brenneria]EHD21818.1 protein of unknown function DUF1482 [Brenneria sp. EniD312]PWC25169.1 DUF1482 domain-containing protein [Brenneria nigrifluens DSM 30175 = ATCC 13028]QCR04924.1 DUF1482 family protein [Brenneria nigrifluens] [Brenneria nigrifluens DSM 30175 = ATCC 13028]
MGTLYALVITVCMFGSHCEDAVLEIYESEQTCIDAAFEQRVNGECLAVEGIIRADDQQPAMKF